MNSQAIAYRLRRMHKQSKKVVESMQLKDFWLALDGLTNTPEAHPEIQVIITTLDGEFPVGCVEMQKNESGDYIISIQTDESTD